MNPKRRVSALICAEREEMSKFFKQIKEGLEEALAVYRNRSYRITAYVVSLKMTARSASLQDTPA